MPPALAAHCLPAAVSTEPCPAPSSTALVAAPAEPEPADDPYADILNFIDAQAVICDVPDVTTRLGLTVPLDEIKVHCNN